MKKTILSLVCLGMMTAASAQTKKLTTTVMKNMMTRKSYTNVSIHDPSIVYNPTDKYYYIQGSHMGVGKSKDLVNWTSIDNGSWVIMPNWWENYQDGSTLFGGKPFWKAFKSCPTHEVQVKRGTTTTTATLGSFDAAAFCATYSSAGDSAWVKGDMWAPDVVYNPNMKKWCMYLSLNGDNWASVIILLTSDYPDHGYTYEAPIVFGGFNNISYTVDGTARKVSVANTDMNILTGSTSLPTRFSSAGKSWGTYYPNCIDPCVFFDEDGELWMSYGSWSGGIWMLKLDKNTGLRDYTTTYSGTTLNANATSDQYFGKKIAGGYYASGEGSYIQHIGKYYYLFMSYGYFDPDGGYEMRIFRSTKPDGEYVDASGNSARYTSYQMNYGPKAATNKGMKIIGAFNDWGTMTTGECAEGHNSATLDPDGNAYVVYHTKFNDGTTGHQVRVRQLFQNEYGWLCASPFRFVKVNTTQGQIDTTRIFSAENIAGTYHLLIHPYKLDYTKYQEATPINVRLSADGSISGDKTGTWAFTKDNSSYIKMVIGGVTYYGVTCVQQEDGYTLDSSNNPTYPNNMQCLCITAVSSGGVPVWASKYMPDAQLASIYNSGSTNTTLVNFYKKAVTTNAPMLENTYAEYTVKNSATKELEPETLTKEGIFTPTSDGHKIIISNIKVVSGDYYYSIVNSTSVATATGSIYYPVSTYRNTTSAWWTNFSKDTYTINSGETKKFTFYNYSSKANTYDNWCLYGASTTHGATGYKEYFGVRNDNWDNTSASNTGCSNDFDMSAFKSDMDSAKVDMIVSYTADSLFNMNTIITTKANKVYHYTYNKTISTKPASLCLFFVNEQSYIESGLYGDTNNDGKVDYADVEEVIKAISGGTTQGNADANHNGRIDVLDVNAVIAVICK